MKRKMLKTSKEEANIPWVHLFTEINGMYTHETQMFTNYIDWIYPKSVCSVDWMGHHFG